MLTETQSLKAKIGLLVVLLSQSRGRADHKSKLGETGGAPLRLVLLPALALSLRDKLHKKAFA